MKFPRFLPLVFASLAFVVSSQAQIATFWIGTGGGPSKGIYRGQLNLKTGRLSATTLAAEIGRPGFLAMHPDRKTLYSVGNLNGKNAITAYRIEGAGNKARLKLLNSVETGDGGSAHVCVDKTGRTVISAQYGGGSVSVFALNKDGSIKERTQVIEHEGASLADPRRQKSPHPHWTGISPDNRFAFIPDLGLDQVVIYRLDAAKSKLTRHGVGQLHAGAGPRHMKFHTSGKWIYVLNELDLTVTVFDYDAKAGTMKAKQLIPTVPKEDLQTLQAKSCSEIRVHPNGKFVYAANRGHDTITAFRVNPDTGELRVIEREFVRGATPRNFNLDPDGKWILAGGQDSHTLAAFVIDQATGELAYNRSVVSTPSPICILFQPE